MLLPIFVDKFNYYSTKEQANEERKRVEYVDVVFFLGNTGNNYKNVSFVGPMLSKYARPQLRLDLHQLIKRS